jgi:hypothetical protein
MSLSVLVSHPELPWCDDVQILLELLISKQKPEKLLPVSLGVAVQACNSSSEAGSEVRDQPGLHSKTLS